MSAIPVDRVAGLIAEAAAIEIAPRFGRLDPAEIREKGPNDLVTVADEGMEHRLSPLLREALAGSVVVGEEAVAADPSIQDRLDAEDWVWVIDPVDGTANFAQGHPVIAVIVALVHRGQTVAGWIHDPLGGATVTAEAGAGAWIAGERMRVSTPAADPAVLKGPINYRYFPVEIRETVRAGRDRVAHVVPLFCAGQEYLRLVRAEIDFAMFWRIKPWDHAAGVLIHAEAGGHAARLDGSAYRPTHREGGLLMAPDPASWAALRKTIMGS